MNKAKSTWPSGAPFWISGHLQAWPERTALVFRSPYDDSMLPTPLALQVSNEALEKFTH